MDGKSGQKDVSAVGFLFSDSLLDYFILFSTVLVFLALVEATVASYQAGQGRVELARSIDRWSRWLFPSVFLLMSVMSLGFRLFL